MMEIFSGFDTDFLAQGHNLNLVTGRCQVIPNYNLLLRREKFASGFTEYNK